MTATPEQMIKEQYVALAKLLKAYHNSPIDKTLLQLTLRYCKSLYGLAQAQPNLVFAQPQLYKSALPLVVNLTFNACVFTCLFATRNKFDPAITIQLMCGSISIYGCDQSSIEKHYQNELDNTPTKLGQNITTMAKLLQQHQQHIWLLAYSLSPSIHSNKVKNISRLKPAGAVAYFANRLSILCTPNKLTPPLSFAKAFKSLTLTAPEKYYSLLSPLLEYPGLTPPGAYIQDQTGTLRIVLAIHAQGLITKELATKQQTTLANKQTEIILTKQKQLTKSYTCQTLKSFSRLSQWWNEDLANWLTNDTSSPRIDAFQTMFSVNAAPPSLLVIQDQLKHTSADISVLVKAIEKEPSYAQQLQVSASLSNRQKQAVSNIQHGLAMLGYERTAGLFLQHSLLSRLNQHYFPLQHAFLAFSQLFVFMVEEIAIKTKSQSVDMVKTAGYFLLSRLFTLPSLRAQQTWKTKIDFEYQADSLIKHSKTANLKQDAILLAQAWQQNTAIIELLQRYDQADDELDIKDSQRANCYLLGACLIMAKQSYFAQTNQCEKTHNYLKKALTELHIDQTEWTELQTSLAIKAKLTCQLF